MKELPREMDRHINPSELKALIQLLDEPEIAIFEQIQNKIYEFGHEAIPYLEEAWQNSFDMLVQNRIEEIIHKINFENTCIELSNWKHFGARNLLLGFIIITRFQFPKLNEEEVKAAIDAIYKDAWLELNTSLTSLEKIKVINHVLYDLHGFTGNKTNYHAIQNSMINHVLNEKTGNPLSLGIIYMIIAQRLNLPVFGVNLPDHFVLAYTNELIEEQISFIDEKEVLFYINPFSHGSVFSRRELELFVEQLKIEPREYFFTPCSNIEIMHRLLNNIRYSYEKLGYKQKIEETDKLIELLTEP